MYFYLNNMIKKILNFFKVKNFAKYSFEDFCYRLQGIPKYPGIEGKEFRVKFNQVIERGTKITYDVMFGDELIVLSNVGLIHKVKNVTTDPQHYFSTSQLRRGTKYVKMCHSTTKKQLQNRFFSIDGSEGFVEDTNIKII